MSERRWAAAALLLLLACEADPLTPADGPLESVKPVVSIQSVAPLPPSVVATDEPPPPVVEPRCAPPSLALAGPLDARDEAALEPCRSASTGPAAAARRCGQGDPVPPLALDRLHEALVPFDAATRERVLKVAQKGKELGRDLRSFGLVGDSMTVSSAFMRPLADVKQTVLAPPVAKALFSEHAGGTILDFFRGAPAQRWQGQSRDAFEATRAAKVGGRADWALQGGAMSPLLRMVDQLSPAIAIVLFGGNDAAYRIGAFADIAADFERDMLAIVEALESRGVVVVLNTVARHGDSGYRDCAGEREMSDWRLAVQTNLLSAKVAELACREHLPLIDVRHAMDAGVNHGLGPDGVHPSAYPKGAAVLDARGLACGYNIRNYVTLAMLGRLVDLIGPSVQ